MDRNGPQHPYYPNNYGAPRSSAPQVNPSNATNAYYGGDGNMQSATDYNNLFAGTNQATPMPPLSQNYIPPSAPPTTGYQHQQQQQPQQQHNQAGGHNAMGFAQPPSSQFIPPPQQSQYTLPFTDPMDFLALPIYNNFDFANAGLASTPGFAPSFAPNPSVPYQGSFQTPQPVTQFPTPHQQLKNYPPQAPAPRPRSSAPGAPVPWTNRVTPSLASANSGIPVNNTGQTFNNPPMQLHGQAHGGNPYAGTTSNSQSYYQHQQRQAAAGPSTYHHYGPPAGGPPVGHQPPQPHIRHIPSSQQAPLDQRDAEFWQRALDFSSDAIKAEFLAKIPAEKLRGTLMVNFPERISIFLYILDKGDRVKASGHTRRPQVLRGIDLLLRAKYIVPQVEGINIMTTCITERTADHELRSGFVFTINRTDFAAFLNVLGLTGYNPDAQTVAVKCSSIRNMVTFHTLFDEHICASLWKILCMLRYDCLP